MEGGDNGHGVEEGANRGASVPEEEQAFRQKMNAEEYQPPQLPEAENINDLRQRVQKEILDEEQ